MGDITSNGRRRNETYGKRERSECIASFVVALADIENTDASEANVGSRICRVDADASGKRVELSDAALNVWCKLDVLREAVEALAWNVRPELVPCACNCINTARGWYV